MAASQENGLTSKSIDPRLFRSVFGRFASGVTVVTTEVEGNIHGMTANAFISVSLNPPLMLISVDNRANMNRLLPVSQRFGVSILAEGQEELSNHFAGRPVDGLKIAFITKEGIPVIDGALAYLVASVQDMHLAGDHTLYIGAVDFLESREEEAPLLFYNGKYHRLSKKETVPGPFDEDDYSMFSLRNFIIARDKK